MAAIPSSAPIVSVLPGLPSAASIIPNTHFHGATVVPLSNTHQVMSLKLTTNNYLYWRMQIKPYLLIQGVYAFLNGSYPCPALYVTATNTVAPDINPFFLLWKQQDQLIMSALLTSLSTEILHLVVDWTHLITYGRHLKNPLLHRHIQGLYSYMVPFRTCVKEMIQLALICNELSDFKDLVTSLSTRVEPLSYSDLHSYLLTHEYLNKSSLQSILGSPMIAPLLPTPLHSIASAFSVQRGGFGGPFSHSYRGRWRHRGGWRGHHGGNHGTSAFGWQQHSRGLFNSNQNFQNVKCQLCYGFGHSAKYCSPFTSQHLQATANLAFQNP
ncbi:hypothetical protein D5086_028289 [Populus alba]|uniref:Uncharacterized protein n=1 Tax=Populus alba TaxID=43335 RepID=A0ACC4AXV0_POPAL